MNYENIVREARKVSIKIKSHKVFVWGKVKETVGLHSKQSRNIPAYGDLQANIPIA
jgi:hypothetical protein